MLMLSQFSLAKSTLLIPNATVNASYLQTLQILVNYVKLMLFTLKRFIAWHGLLRKLPKGFYIDNCILKQLLNLVFA